MAIDIIFKHKLYESDDADYNKDATTNYIGKEEDETNSVHSEESEEDKEPKAQKDRDLSIFKKQPKINHERKLLNGDNFS